MFHLTQLNIGKLLHPIDHPQIAEFVNNLERVNKIAESSKGFVWRLKDESGNATGIEVFDDPLIIVNMSVWKTVEDLKNFAFKSIHVDFMRKRRQWFEKPESEYLVLWWIPKGHFPSAEDAKNKLYYLQQHGESNLAFTFKKLFEPPKF